jgi:hypothetical protein
MLIPGNCPADWLCVLMQHRCPGCNQPWQQQVVQSFLDEMTAFLRNAGPNQLIALGTEGKL